MENVSTHLEMEGLYMVNFNNGEIRRNSLLPAIIYPYTGPTPPRKRLMVNWLNGFSAVVKPEDINVFKLNQQ